MDIHSLIALATEAAQHAPAAETVAETAHAAEESGGVLGTLGINWKLLLGQAVNFGIILLVLWKWVFKPVSGALESRRLKIEQSLSRAEAIEQQMKEADEARTKNLAEARAEAERIIGRTTAEAEKNRQETLTAARTEADKILMKAKEAIEAEKQQMLREVKGEVAELVVSASEKILAEKLDDKKDRELVTKVLHEIQR